MDWGMPGFPVCYQDPKPAQTHVHRVSDAIQPCHRLSSPSPPAFNLYQHQGLFQWLSSPLQLAKVFQFQLQHQSLQWIFRTDSLRIDWLDLLAVQGTLKSLFQHHSSKASIFQHSASLWSNSHIHTSVSQSVSPVVQSCPTLWDHMNCRMPGLPVHHQLPKFTQTHVHWVSDAIQPSHRLSSPSPPFPNPSQHQSLFQWVNSSHEVAKILGFQLQHQSFQCTPRNDLL